MKVVFVNRYFAPDECATSQLLSDLAFDVVSDEWAVHVVTCRHLHGDPRTRLNSHERLGRVMVHRVWTSSFGRDRLAGRAVDYLTFYASAGWTLWWLARRGDIIVAKTDPPLLSIIGAIVARLRGAILINWLQDVFPEVAIALTSKPAIRRCAALLAGPRNASLRAAAFNVTLGPRMAERVASFGVERNRITVLANWADGQAIQPLSQAANPLRTDWNLVDRFVVGYSGNMGRAHEFGTMLDAAEALREDPRIVFVLIGGGNWKAWIQSQVRCRELTNVVLKPYQPREALRYSLLVPDVHLISLQPALEGLVVPSKLYGIAAAGRPIMFVGDPDGDVAAFLRTAKCGATVKVGDATGLADHLQHLNRSADLRDDWGQNARAAFMAHYDRPIACAAWRDLLYRVTASSRARASIPAEGERLQGQRRQPQRAPSMPITATSKSGPPPSTTLPG